ncbi:hypothetical protein E2C01_016031 [Portunus trituberculatus]|uniref:Uncharacterized protein n=1 Tax=Portunus trituberculatus TaxID=210409 RepID=A0A5B7DNH3_PORTR|nr:hypothetical protein [Portunus trituberculatus]
MPSSGFRRGRGGGGLRRPPPPSAPSSCFQRWDGRPPTATAARHSSCVVSALLAGSLNIDHGASIPEASTTTGNQTGGRGKGLNLDRGKFTTDNLVMTYRSTRIGSVCSFATLSQSSLSSTTITHRTSQTSGALVLTSHPSLAPTFPPSPSHPPFTTSMAPPCRYIYYTLTLVVKIAAQNSKPIPLPRKPSYLIYESLPEQLPCLPPSSRQHYTTLPRPTDGEVVLDGRGTAPTYAARSVSCTKGTVKTKSCEIWRRL